MKKKPEEEKVIDSNENGAPFSLMKFSFLGQFPWAVIRRRGKETGKGASSCSWIVQMYKCISLTEVRSPDELKQFRLVTGVTRTGACPIKVLRRRSGNGKRRIKSAFGEYDK